MNQELWYVVQELREHAARKPKRGVSRVAIPVQSRQLEEWADRIESNISGTQPEDGQPHDRRGQWDGMPGGV